MMSNRHIPLEQRFWSRVIKADGCWQWTGPTFPFGHGSISAHGKTTRAHRVSWELHNGPIPVGMHVLHKCDNPPCVNPEHLYLGTNVENTRDRDARRRQANSRKTHCKRGHPLSGDNLYVKPTGYRQCMECRRAAHRLGRLQGRWA